MSKTNASRPAGRLAENHHGIDGRKQPILLWISLGLGLFFWLSLPAPKAVAQAAQSPWSTLALTDVQALHEAVTTIHPGMRDTATPDFPNRVAEAYRTAETAARGATSYQDWRASTLGYIASFRDGHTIYQAAFAPAAVRWPGAMDDDPALRSWVSALATRYGAP